MVFGEPFEAPEGALLSETRRDLSNADAYRRDRRDEKGDHRHQLGPSRWRPVTRSDVDTILPSRSSIGQFGT